jgi:DNA-binding transcriptional LysR family regulator
VAVKEAGGFTRAAQRLHLTQSAVSHQIRRLEEQVGRPLLCRTTRTLTLTEDGNDFLRYAEQILASLDELNHRFREWCALGYQRRLWASACRCSYLNSLGSFPQCDLT